MRWWTFPILVALAGSSHLECQESSKVSYDGQRAAAVDLVANPKISVDSLRPLIQQKADEAYSTPQVEATMSALKETGRFSKVELDVKPDPGGLRVTFTLEPALYSGSFSFQEPRRVFLHKAFASCRFTDSARFNIERNSLT